MGVASRPPSPPPPHSKEHMFLPKCGITPIWLILPIKDPLQISVLVAISPDLGLYLSDECLNLT